MSDTLIDRFWELVDKRPDGCWLWKGHTHSGVRPLFREGTTRVAAHRFAYQLKHGELHANTFLKHTCDNTLCVNPDHLRTRRVYIPPTLMDKINNKVDMNMDTGCWIYTGTIDPSGYGRIKYKGSNKSVHRAMWEAVNGAIDRKTIVRQSCGDLTCINPEHLYTEQRTFAGNGYTRAQDKKTTETL